MTRGSGCIFHITDRFCVIQDRISRMLIEAGEQQYSLYFFRGVAVVAAMRGKNSTSMELWHYRLGHLSSKALEMFRISDFK